MGFKTRRVRKAEVVRTSVLLAALWLKLQVITFPLPLPPAPPPRKRYWMVRSAQLDWRWKTSGIAKPAWKWRATSSTFGATQALHAGSCSSIALASRSTLAVATSSSSPRSTQQASGKRGGSDSRPSGWSSHSGCRQHRWRRFGVHIRRTAWQRYRPQGHDRAWLGHVRTRT